MHNLSKWHAAIFFTQVLMHNFKKLWREPKFRNVQKSSTVQSSVTWDYRNQLCLLEDASWICLNLTRAVAVAVFNLLCAFVDAPISSAIVMLGKFILTLGVFARCENFSSDDTCVLQTQRKSRYDPPEGLGPGGNPVSRLPNPTQDVSIDDEVIACADPKWQPNAQNIWTFEQIGEAFMEFGYKKFYKPGSVDPVSTCVAALTIVSGECQETLQSTGIGCDAKSTGDSGVFQLDYLLSPKTPLREKILPQVEKEGNMMNLCISGFGAGYLTGAPYATNPLNKAVASLVQTSLYTCMDSPADVNDYSCPDPHAKKGVIYSNFIGTFCHKSYLQRWAPCNIHSTEDRCCGLFNGGANNDGALDQPPFPEYYYKKADVHLQKMPKGKNFKTICEKIVEKMEAPSLEEVAEAASRQICEGTIESGDTCYIVKQWWNVPYSAIKNKETGEVCPKPLGWVGQKLEITNPPGGCGGLWPNPPPPVPCAEYDGQFTFAVDKWSLSWMLKCRSFFPNSWKLWGPSQTKPWGTLGQSSRQVLAGSEVPSKGSK